MARRIGRMLARLGRPLRMAIDYALPPRCAGCGTIAAADHVFCVTCWQRLDFLGGPACGQCAAPLPGEWDEAARCGACLAAPPPFDSLRAAVAYGPIARALALKLKYGRRPGTAVTMARIMRRRAAALIAPGTLVVPVPLHRRRLWARGYNQAALIARAVVSGTEGVMVPDLLRRTRATVPLRAMGPAGRARTVAGAFAVHPAWRTRLAGRHIVLVDDVYTTGATVKACARVLKQAGAAQVAVLCWARVVATDAADPPMR